ncbi:hypothetical protein J8M20_09205 [Pseudoalteromonas luteoviolacea]|uniref:hypothetical protein n=1 Tax=Pseudoalteromonas luteoviolacea TaxID=43657 RepID=UPI001B363087|nr:hypothetical protein [Pseudoalteromonas luteoviolacea]MBQ4811515.1 hypothetical protein [Pseudoalteromonas luteoviolacea]
MKNLSKITMFYFALLSPFLVAQEQEIDNRMLESCVLGNLPQEIQYNMIGNPIVLSGKVFPKEKAVELRGQLDGRLISLIVKSASRTNSVFNVEDLVLDDLNSEYVNGLVSNMALYAPEVFGVTFCGQSELVANFILAQSFQYLAKALIGSGEKKVDWLKSNKKELNELGVIITIVTIYLAGKDENKLHKFIESLS